MFASIARFACPIGVGTKLWSNRLNYTFYGWKQTNVLTKTNQILYIYTAYHKISVDGVTATLTETHPVKLNPSTFPPAPPMEAPHQTSRVSSPSVTMV